MIYGVLEIEIMNAIWDMQEQNEDRNIAISDVVDMLKENNVFRAYTTIKTVMDRLVSKGILARFKSGKKFFYTTTVSRIEAKRNTINEVSNQFFSGNFEEMIRFIEQNQEVVFA